MIDEAHGEPGCHRARLRARLQLIVVGSGAASAPLAEEAGMSHETTTTLAGNLTADPEPRFTAAGVPVAQFTVAATSRVQDSSSGPWRGGDTLFLRCTVWRRTAENVAKSLRKGQPCRRDRLPAAADRDRNGQKRSVIELATDEVSVSLRHAIVRPDPSGSHRAGPSAAPPRADRKSAAMTMHAPVDMAPRKCAAGGVCQPRQRP
jgi:single-strand DNA-binding protein